MADIAVISQHEKGFWQADIYFGASGWGNAEWDAAPSPDGFATAPTRTEVEAKVRDKLPEIKICDAVEDDFDNESD